MTDRAPRHHHPFGRTANAFVHLGATLGLVQALVFVLTRAAVLVTSPAGGEGIGPLVLVALLGGVPWWLSWRALWWWRARRPSSLGWILAAGVLMMPLGPLVAPFGGAFYTVAGLLLCIGGVLARPRIAEAERARRPGG